MGNYATPAQWWYHRAAIVIHVAASEFTEELSEEGIDEFSARMLEESDSLAADDSPGRARATDMLRRKVGAVIAAWLERPSDIDGSEGTCNVLQVAARIGCKELVLQALAALPWEQFAPEVATLLTGLLGALADMIAYPEVQDVLQEKVLAFAAHTDSLVLAHLLTALRMLADTEANTCLGNFVRSLLPNACARAAQSAKQNHAEALSRSWHSSRKADKSIGPERSLCAVLVRLLECGCVEETREIFSSTYSWMSDQLVLDVIASTLAKGFAAENEPADAILLLHAVTDFPDRIQEWLCPSDVLQLTEVLQRTLPLTNESVRTAIRRLLRRAIPSLTRSTYDISRCARCILQLDNNKDLMAELVHRIHCSGFLHLLDAEGGALAERVFAILGPGTVGDRLSALLNEQNSYDDDDKMDLLAHVCRVRTFSDEVVEAAKASFVPAYLRKLKERQPRGGMRDLLKLADVVDRSSPLLEEIAAFSASLAEPGPGRVPLRCHIAAIEEQVCHLRECKRLDSANAAAHLLKHTVANMIAAWNERIPAPPAAPSPRYPSTIHFGCGAAACKDCPAVRAFMSSEQLTFAYGPLAKTRFTHFFSHVRRGALAADLDFTVEGTSVTFTKNMQTVNRLHTEEKRQAAHLRTALAQLRNLHDTLRTALSVPVPERATAAALVPIPCAAAIAACAPARAIPAAPVRRLEIAAATVPASSATGTGGVRPSAVASHVDTAGSVSKIVSLDNWVSRHKNPSLSGGAAASLAPAGDATAAQPAAESSSAEYDEIDTILSLTEF